MEDFAVRARSRRTSGASLGRLPHPPPVVPSNMLLLASLALAVEAAPALPEPARRFGVAIGVLGPEEAGLELRGVRIAARYDLLGALTLELAGRSDPGALREPTEHQATVVANSHDDMGLSYLRLPVQSVDWELSARADWGFVPRRAAGRLTGGPRLMAGVGVRAIDHSELTAVRLSACGECDAAEDFVSINAEGATVSPVLDAALAVDLWFGRHVGIELRWAGVLWWAPEAVYSTAQPDPPTGFANLVPWLGFEPGINVHLAL